jgi:hypothetical protein
MELVYITDDHDNDDEETDEFNQKWHHVNIPTNKIMLNKTPMGNSAGFYLY